MTPSTSFIEEIEDGISYGRQVRNRLEKIHDIFDSFCTGLQTVLQNQYNNLIIDCGFSQNLDKTIYHKIIKQYFSEETEFSLAFVFIKAEKKIVQKGNNQQIKHGSVSCNCSIYPLFRYSVNEESGYPVYLLYNFEKSYCNSELELRNAIVQAFKARSADVLSFLEKI